MTLFYKVRDAEPLKLYAPGYGNGSYTSSDLGCVPSDSNPQLCANESEMLRLVIPKIKEGTIERGCIYENEEVVRSYASPYRLIGSENFSAREAVIQFQIADGSPSNERGWQYDIRCPGWPKSDRRVQPLTKFQRFSCAEGFHPIMGPSREYSQAQNGAATWPKICRNYSTYQIVVKIRQVESVCTANPCHPTTGDKSRTEFDFDFANQPFIRSYHSLGQVQGKSSGAGWMHSYEERLDLNSGRPPVLLTALGYIDGMQAISGKAGIFRSSTTEGRLLVSLNDGSYKLIEPDGRVKRFDATGRLTEVDSTHPSIGTVRLLYNENRLDAAIDEHDRSLIFHYSGDLLSEIGLPDGNTISYKYDNFRNLISADYGDGRVKSYHYSEPGLASSALENYLTGITSESGERYGSFSYDDQGRVISSVLHATAGTNTETVSLVYKSDTETAVTYPLGETRTFFNLLGTYRRLSEVHKNSGVILQQYTSDGRLASTSDSRNFKTQYEYTDWYRSAIVSAVGTNQERREEVVRDREYNALLSNKTYDAGGHALRTLTSTYNTRGQALTSSRTDPVAATTRTTVTTYCEQTDIDADTCPLLGLTTSVDGPRSDLSDLLRYTYYAIDDSACAATPNNCAHRKGDLWKVTNALGQTTEYLAYDGAGRPLSIKDTNGIVTDYTYHPRGWLTASKVRGADASSEADDRITRIDYWPTGLVKQVTQPDGAFTAFTYDAAHRLTDITDNAGNTVHYTLDNAGNRVKEDTTDASGTLKRTLSRVYNQLGQLKTQATAASDPTDFEYDANGNATKVTDALATATQSEYDPLNRLSRTLQDVAGIKANTTFDYDALDNLTKVTDPKGLDTKYEYNGFGDLVKLTSPDTGVTSYTYDSAGNRATQTDARGNTTGYGYDALNRLTKVTYPTTSLNVTYTYDVTQTACASGETFSIGRLTKMQDGGAITQYCYNRFGDLARKVQTSNGKALVLRYDYTVGGQLRRMTYPDGAVVDYVRNAQGQTTEVGVTPAGGSRQVLLGNASYYPFGPAAGWTYGNGRTLARRYDLDYRPQAIQDTRPGGLEVGFGFDPAGNLTALTPAGNSTPEIGLGYDALGRLTGLKDGRTGTLIDGYSYDATGNRLSAKVGTATQAYTYPADSHRLSAVAGVARSYDATGNTTAIGGTARQYTYDTTGRMTQARRAGAVTMNYRYNGKGEQVRRFLGTTNTYTLYDEAGHWLGDYDTNGAPKQQAIWLDDLPVGLLANANKLHYIEPDHLGSPRVVIDPNRDVAVWTWSLKGEAFGNTAPNQDPDGDGAALVLDMRFPGQRFDAASGLNQNYFRDYDAATGRYGQSDPIGLDGGISTYAYVKSKPLTWIDIFGLDGGLVCGPADNEFSDCSRTAPGAWKINPPADDGCCTKRSETKILTRKEADDINGLNGDVGNLICTGVGALASRAGVWGGVAIGVGCGYVTSRAKAPAHEGDILHVEVEICPDATGNNDRTKIWIENRQ
ncbi:RHS repeat-associated protein [Xanthomonas sp. 3272]|uniref:RHS repeat-associated core domain-containing protein n=1 Tax=Xanthomonas arboricola TaxID=56448 RepID=UPI00168DD584|nr:RHS repeat-associated core domain-containing protein [Xanthomonas arboricola]NJC00727.1 RHS repeat-associated protein [Xanthomonas arboricola]